MGEENFIPAIFNYCNRWCERCRFINRCALGAAEQKRWKKDAPESNETTWEEVEENLREALGMLDKMIEEAGLEMPDPEAHDDLPNDEAAEEEDEMNPMARQLTEQVRAFGTQYFKEVDGFFRQHVDLFKARGIEVFPSQQPDWKSSDRSVLSDAVEIIRWNMHFQFVKAERAVYGMEEMAEEYWEPYQSDANGSAKASILSTGESVKAWMTLREYLPELAEPMQAFEALLRQFRRLMQTYFYDWQKFVRPGFDTEPEEPQFGLN